jgi:hypothetical protein
VGTLPITQGIKYVKIVGQWRIAKSSGLSKINAGGKNKNN